MEVDGGKRYGKSSTNERAGTQIAGQPHRAQLQKTLEKKSQCPTNTRSAEAPHATLTAGSGAATAAGKWATNTADAVFGWRAVYTGDKGR